ncbi:class I SAM-dependent methyltransferase [Neptunomonas marina]|uniref:Class I SAM-dependent methyltransferase n=1 Tax=Neptunomonas marina TaxID=1815562 RepID=A0A437QDR1_9GAMM|nr:class I SAM-dependent methyltransferase [Neptunomonas marina]RVU32585.1 class I SAM-dependent methyltransferase [Neptunomonas marina]
MMWEENYNIDHYTSGKEPNLFLKQQIGCLPPQARVLCLTTANGYDAVHLALAGFHVTAVDISWMTLDATRQLAEQNELNIELIRADLLHYPLGYEEWDAVVSLFYQPPRGAQATMYQRMMNALKPGGVLILEGYTEKHLRKLKKDIGPALAAERLKRALPDAQFLQLEELERPQSEQTSRMGTLSVVQAVAVKPK